MLLGHVDGVNVDYESPILQNETTIRNGFTALIRELTQKLKAASANYMVKYIILLHTVQTGY